MKPLKKLLKKFLSYETNPHKLALACAVGTYVGFSPFPFPFGHTSLVFLFSWILGINVSATWLMSMIVNNPWTMVPVYSLDYGFGYWLVRHYYGIIPTNPCWMASVNDFIQSFVSMPDICFWSFMIGGNLLGIAIGAMIYPIAYFLFRAVIKAQSATYENNNYQ